MTAGPVCLTETIAGASQKPEQFVDFLGVKILVVGYLLGFANQPVFHVVLQLALMNLHRVFLLAVDVFPE